MSQRMHHYSRQASVDERTVPAVNTRFFYRSLLGIDDPLSPVPPPSTDNASVRMTLQPFSPSDHTMLENAWGKLQAELVKYAEEKGFKQRRVDASRESFEGDVPTDIHSFNNHATGAHGSQSSSRQGSISRESQFGSRRQSHARSSADIVRDVPGKGGLGTVHGSPRKSDIAATETSSEKDNVVTGLTARPFARLPSRKKLPTASQVATVARRAELEMRFEDDLAKNNITTEQLASVSAEIPTTQPVERVPVGVSRLHQVMMPELRMQPIYWSPVHDIATVVRATWFYKDTMLPVDVDVAIMLEAGYLRLEPWTQTWKDEIDSAAEAGAIGEEKIMHRLWPETPRKAPSRPGSAVQEDPEVVRSEMLNTACHAIDTLTPQDKDFKASGSTGDIGARRRRYLDSAILYTSATEAYLLRPNLQPSAYYGRRPFANYIRKGYNIGVPVVRGFDQSTWAKLNPPAKGKTVSAAQDGVRPPESGASSHRRMTPDASLNSSQRPRVTDLILVIHGIGQKLSERVESFHFTHAMNTFRREVNVELGTPQVKSMLRCDHGGIMVLPVNWRSTLAFEEGGYGDQLNSPSANDYSLQDITPETLPSVRNIVSDVMLDIPYYLSHHQPKIISAVIREANRIHQLWCTHNPGFEGYGRVHIIAHSLGSVMAIDILSNQPTTVKESDVVNLDLNHFRFDVTNLYLAGSPAGFFLLLKAASLTPRKGKGKPSSNGDDMSSGIAGNAGTYGCLAVDNIYNVINPYDPVSYRMNACIDVGYAASIKQALIPSTSSSWFALGNPFKLATAATRLQKPGPPPRLPSNVELETHNFTQEEIAEKRFYLLNDNGQIDFFLRYGGGALDIQYLTMLGAHSSYWITKDFIRFIVMETGRMPGRENTLEPLRPVKKKDKVR